MKVREIVGHLEKLEDYHRGDGMRIQKMLGDMYWDYTAIRETIGDCMADCGYAGREIWHYLLKLYAVCCHLLNTPSS